VFGTARGEVFGHDIRVGLKRWGFALSDRIRGNPVMVGRIAGAVAESGDVLLVNPENGEAISSLGSIYGGLANNPISDGVNMYIASTDQSVYAFGGTTGELLWRVRTQSRLTAQPALHEGVLYQQVPNEGLVAIDTGDGQRRWANPDIDGSVIAVRNGDLVVWNGSEAMLVDTESGDVFDRVEVPGVRQIITNGFEDGELIVLTGNSGLARFVSR
jgi:outer membrane protein assembly factor BamB